MLYPIELRGQFSNSTTAFPSAHRSSKHDNLASDLQWPGSEVIFMRKFCCFSMFLVLAVVGSAAQDQDFSKVEIKVTKVSGTVYMLQGAGGNIGVSVGDDGIVIVDDEFAPLAPKIRAALATITSKPIKFILNTHYHGDHTGGNTEFAK